MLAQPQKNNYRSQNSRPKLNCIVLRAFPDFFGDFCIISSNVTIVQGTICPQYNVPWGGTMKQRTLLNNIFKMKIIWGRFSSMKFMNSFRLLFFKLSKVNFTWWVKGVKICMASSVFIGSTHTLLPGFFSSNIFVSSSQRSYFMIVLHKVLTH